VSGAIDTALHDRSGIGVKLTGTNSVAHPDEGAHRGPQVVVRNDRRSSMRNARMPGKRQR